MALSAQLGGANLKPDSVETRASLTLEKLDVGFTTTRIHLDVTAKIPGATSEALLKAAEEAKRTCPISRLLNTTITLEARLG
jgi:osmotically inducible protein OsmC